MKREFRRVVDQQRQNGHACSCRLMPLTWTNLGATLQAMRRNQKNTTSETTCPCLGDTVPRFLQPLVLLILVDGDRHGYEILQRIVQTGIFSDSLPSEPGLYRILKDLEKRGLCASSWDTTGSGPARHVYSITASGRECLANWQKTLQSYTAFLEKMTGLIEKSLEK
jgi:poly-beta-hydroxybutyrate-responsive repressor